ncbi:MAG: hypothetical protein ACTSU5_10590 [Promethearchaeota archaeon]
MKYQADVLWFPNFSRSANQGVLLMLSGGSGSALCAAVLLDFGIHFEAVHFWHDWSWPLATREARRVADLLGVKLHVVNLTKDFRQEVLGRVGRPCPACKELMDQRAIRLCVERGLGWICTGEISEDATVLARLGSHISGTTGAGADLDVSKLYVSDYLDCGGEAGGIRTPRPIKVLRPLLHLRAVEVEELLREEHGLTIKRVHEAGDPGVEYWREGCPLHYVDPGTTITGELADELFRTNLIATELARAGGFRAAVFLPSGRVVTVPAGREVDLERILKFRAGEFSS